MVVLWLSVAFIIVMAIGAFVMDNFPEFGVGDLTEDPPIQPIPQTQPSWGPGQTYYNASTGTWVSPPGAASPTAGAPKQLP